MDQSLGLKKRVQEDVHRIDEIYRVGVEVEACLLDDKALPVNAYPLIKELCSKYKVDTEYGKCQFEIITDPMSMHNLSNINLFFEEFLDFLSICIKKVYRNRQVIPVFLAISKAI